jgi:hypothetical protein
MFTNVYVLFTFVKDKNTLRWEVQGLRSKVKGVRCEVRKVGAEGDELKT